MSDLTRTIVDGYRTLFHHGLTLLLGVVTLAAVSAAVTLPVWFLASRWPGVFNVLVLALITFALAWIILHRPRRSDLASRPGRSRTGFLVRMLLLLIPGVLVLAGAASWSGPLLIAGLLLLSLVGAWIQGRR